MKCKMWMRVILLGLSLQAFGAFAAERITVSAAGQKQGEFKSDGASKVIVLKKFSLEVTRPTTPGGLATGARLYQPLVITKDITECSPQFFEALINNETLTHVTLQLYKASREGKEVEYYTIKLTNASVTKIHQFTSDAADTKGQQMEEISLHFQKIEITELNGKTTVIDTPHERQ